MNSLDQAKRAHNRSTGQMGVRFDRPVPYTSVDPGRGLGLAPQTLSAILSAGRDVATGPLTAARQRLSDQFGQPGAPGLGSGSYMQALAGLEGSRVAAGAGNLSDALIQDETLRRSDLDRRLAAISGFYGSLVRGRGMYAGGNMRQSGTSRGISGSISYGLA